METRSFALNERQFGFRKGVPTLDATQLAKTSVEVTNFGDYRTRKLEILIVLDIRNAFNSVKWLHIINKVSTIEVNKKLITTMCNYFKNRKLIIRLM